MGSKCQAGFCFSLTSLSWQPCFGHRYYAMPLVELMSQTSRGFYSVLMGKHEMAFDVLMWTEETRTAVFHHLREEDQQGPQGQGLQI